MWTYYAGATLTKVNNRDFGGITMGSYILGDKSIDANPNNQLFQHEYGHCLQSQLLGPVWAFVYGFPSLIEYWKKRDSNYKGWEHFNNPIKKPISIR